MRVAFLDCFAGVSGDMLLGALLDAGVPEQVLHDAVASLNLGATLKVEKVDRSGISSTKVHVLEGSGLAENNAAAPGHHHHGRHLKTIRKIIESSNLEDKVKQTSIETFELLGESEARIHNVDVEKIHFHEVGAVDAIVDIVAASAGVHALGVDHWFCSALNVGSGMVDCAHGRFPVPAPATADLLRGLPTYSAGPQMELVTPTGAALVRSLAPTFGQQPAMRVHNIGYGAGTLDPRSFPNVLRLSVGESYVTTRNDDQTVTVIETALDDLNPQVIAHVAEQALQQGALDVMLTPVIMKKGRAGTLATVLCDPENSAALEGFLLRETSTLGVRIRQERRSCLQRAHQTVSTPYGEIRIKTGLLGKEEINATPEFEDCRKAAAAHNVPVKLVLQSAIAAYRAGQPR